MKDIQQLPGETKTQRNARVLRFLADQVESGHVVMTRIDLKQNQRARFGDSGMDQLTETKTIQSMVIHIENAKSS